MARKTRIVGINLPYHITQRGNDKKKVFYDEFDYLKYIEILEEHKSKYDLSILAYCLMPNHVHFAVIPHKNESLARTFGISHMKYSFYFNKLYDKSGHLWKNRFYSCILDNKYLYYVIRYIEYNPVRANLVRKASNWKWSSARAHLNIEKSKLSLVDIDKFIKVNSWDNYLCEDNKTIMTTDIRSKTMNGNVLGDKIFISKLERKFNKRITPLPTGRPRKSTV